MNQIFKALATALALVIVTLTCNGFTLPQVSNLEMHQREYSHDVEINFTLSHKAIVTLEMEIDNERVPANLLKNLNGDIFKEVESGNRRITWKAGLDWPGNITTNARVKLTLWSVDAPPLYSAIKISDNANKFPVFYYPDKASVPGGITAERYKTDYILLRKIEPSVGKFYMMGAPLDENSRKADNEDSVAVILTNSFYIGTYLITQQQYYHVTGKTPSKFNKAEFWATRPVEQATYYHIRENPAGSQGSAISPNWPQSDQVGEGSFMDIMRKKTDIPTFDLPTEAQWEWACRAGTTGAFNDGTYQVQNTNIDTNLDKLGRYRYNGGYIDNGANPPAANCDTNNATMTVGSYLPNAWDLYDMHGNLKEFVLDWYDPVLSGGVEPKGPPVAYYPAKPEEQRRVARGGCWHSGRADCRSGARSGIPLPDYVDHALGFRLSRRLP